MIYKGKNFFRHKCRDLFHIISPLNVQLRISSRKSANKHIMQLVIYKIIGLHNNLFMVFDGKWIIWTWMTETGHY